MVKIPPIEMGDFQFISLHWSTISKPCNLCPFSTIVLLRRATSGFDWIKGSYPRGHFSCTPLNLINSKIKYPHLVITKTLRENYRDQWQLCNYNFFFFYFLKHNSRRRWTGRVDLQITGHGMEYFRTPSPRLYRSLIPHTIHSEISRCSRSNLMANPHRAPPIQMNDGQEQPEWFIGTATGGWRWWWTLDYTECESQMFANRTVHTIHSLKHTLFQWTLLIIAGSAE